MIINAVFFLYNRLDQPPVRGNINGGRPQDLESEKSRYGLPAVFLVKNSHLNVLKAFQDVVIDRGIKNKSKGLAEYLTGLEGGKIPVMDGNYAAAGRLRQGVQALLNQAKIKGEKKLYIIGTSSALFDKIWHEASNEPGEKQTHTDSVIDSYHKNPGFTGVNSWLLKELCQRCEVPSKLKERYLGNSEDFALIRLLVMVAAQNLDPVLIIGGTGSGKEIVARQIHHYSQRSSGPFISVNCGAIPEDILESELFGHTKGAFTNAYFDKKGLWSAAINGTLFLDEIGDLSLANQVKILRVIAEGSCRPVGLTEETKVNARIISATNRDLFEMVQSGEFREDLYYRLRSFFIRTPALSNNKENIPQMAQILWKQITPQNSKPLPPEILTSLKEHSWPGNVRELKTVLTSLKNLFYGRDIGVGHLRSIFYLEGRPEGPINKPVTEKDLLLEKAKCLRHLRRAHEIIHACRNAVHDFIKIQTPDKEKTESGQTNLKLRYHELLQFCCFGPEFYPNEETFVAVGTIKDKMTWLTTRLKDDPLEVKEFWEIDLKAGFKNIQAVLFKSIERLISES
jgi:hypothetical protein